MQGIEKGISACPVAFPIVLRCLLVVQVQVYVYTRKY